MSDLRSMCEAMLRKQAQVKQAQETIAAFDKQWLENDYLVLDDLLWVMAEASPDNRKAYIEPIIQSAITSKALTVWDENKSFRLNDKVLHTQYIPRKTLVFKKDFLVWLKQTNAVPFPQRLIDLGGCDIHVTPDIENLIAENESLKAKVAELEQRLSEYKELPTQTKNKVMPIIYGLCCLYDNKGKPLTKSRASCNSIAKELTKFKVVITGEGLEKYYKQGMDILGHDE